MGNQQSSSLKNCLEEVCAGRDGCMAVADDPLFSITWAKQYNLGYPTVPSAVIKPDNASQVAATVKCAVNAKTYVQARSGGHSYGNYGLGGGEKGIAIDLVNLQDFSMDTSTWQAAVGAGMSLGDLDHHLHSNGHRAMAHGTCPGVGIGGHATIGGLGPMSRMWGSALDHVVEVEVVTADGQIQRASELSNADLFWAIRGAGASFGIVTEFVVKTHPEPGDVIQYSYEFDFGKQSDMRSVFTQWQDVVADPGLDRRFSTLFIAQPMGVLITGTFYGTQEDFDATGIEDRLPGEGKSSVNIRDWMGHLTHEAEVEGLYLSDMPSPFYSKSLAFRPQDKLSATAIDTLFGYLDSADPDTVLWAVMFNSEGGAMSDIASDLSCYPHRDKFMMYQSYVVGMPKLSEQNRAFLDGFHYLVTNATSTPLSTYAGYIDISLDQSSAQELYWGNMLPKLREIKAKWDPDQVFRNPQSVQPAG